MDRSASRILPLLLCFLLSPAVRAQHGPHNAAIDSLEALLDADPALTTHRVDLLNQLGYEYWIVHPTRSLRYGAEALELAKLLPYPGGAAFAKRVLGVAHWARGNLELSFRYLIDARTDYAALADSLGVANTSLNLGMAYADQGNYDLADRNYQDALRRFHRERDTSRIATTYTKIADLLLLEGNYPPAADFLQQALALHQSQGFTYGIGEANRKLGQLAAARGNHDQAISYHLLAIEASGRRDDHVGLADSYYGIGRAYLAKEKLGLAEDYLDRARRLAEGFELQRVRRDVYLALKELEKARGNPAAALAYAERYLDVRDSLFNKEKSNLLANMEARRAYARQEEELSSTQRDLELAAQKDKVSRLTKWLLLLGLLAAIATAYALLARKDRVIDRKRADLRAARRRGDDLEQVLRTKAQELTSYALNFAQKNEGITALKTEIEGLRRKVGPEHRASLRAIGRQVEGLLRVDEDWADFRRHFEGVHPELLTRLAEEYPGLTNNEFRLIALIRLNLSTKEIGALLGISPDSVKTARYRLRKKLGLTTQDNLLDFLLGYGQRS